MIKQPPSAQVPHAIPCLLKQGSPPSAASIITNPNQRIQTACQALASLLSQLTRSFRTTAKPELLTHWVSSVCPWIIFLLRHILIIARNKKLDITTDANAPSSLSLSFKPEWINVLDYLTSSLPTTAFGLPPSDLRAMKSSPSTSSLQPLLAQIFLLKLDSSDPSWSAWASVQKDIALCGTAPATSDPSPDFSDPCLYPPNGAHLGGILLKELNARIPTLRQMSTSQLRHFQVLLVALIMAADCFPDGATSTPLAIGTCPGFSPL
ncbi:hypothetical protein PQX77_020682 [Marasmius sp. AFHP31]|nr:hypothetical protein PQX77_020682 [Marasmius sp. AFHP31]